MPRGDTIRELDEQMATLVRRAVDDLRVQMRRRLEEATAELQQRLGEAVPDLPESFISDDHIRRIAEEAAGPAAEELEEARAAGRAEARGAAHRALRAALAEIDRARTQGDVLAALLRATEGYAERAAVLLLRDDRFVGWGARGFETDDEMVRGASLGAEREPWAAIAGGGPARVLPSAGSAGLVSQLDSPLSHQAYAVPLVLRDRVAAVVYADRVGDNGALDVDAVQVLGYAAALALETLAFRDRELTATLRPAERPEGEEADPLAVAEPADTGGAEVGGDEALDLAAPEEDGPVTVHEEAEVYELSDETELELDDVEIEGAAEPVEIEELPPEEALAFQDEPGEIPIRGYDYPREVEDDEDDEAGEEGEDAEILPAEPGEPAEPEGEAVDESALDETAFEEAPESEDLPEVEESPEVEEPEVPPSTATVAWSPRAVPDHGEMDERRGEGDDGEVATVGEDEDAGAAPPPAPPAAGGPVEPPADIDGPGWAFSATKEPVSKDQEAAHEEARRLARLLVSEIQLYNQDEVEEGRSNRDIYERLRDDIDRSRQLYEERVDAEVRESTDYFYQELVRQLAAGDAKALGI